MAEPARLPTGADHAPSAVPHGPDTHGRDPNRREPLDGAATLEQAWELSYLDPQHAALLGQRLAEHGGMLAGWGWLHVALSETRIGDAAQADRAAT